MQKTRQKTNYQCTECGALAAKWSGQCGDCGAWNTLQETLAVKSAMRVSRAAGNNIENAADVVLASEPRTATGIAELDRVLGGGLVDGSVVLLGGDPGIGKSTLLIQTLASLSVGMKTLYLTGEESLQQVTLRAKRLDLPVDKLRLLSETCVEQILETCHSDRPQALVIDSIQTLYSESLQSAPGSVSQVRECAAQLVRFAKRTQTALFLVGHVTKEGTLAGPRVLEHMVDTVLYFEGDPSSRFRVIRAVKNRFGTVNELGVFAMGERGLQQVSNPSALFLSQHSQPVSGSAIMVTRHGTRPLLVEAQALVDSSHLSNPRRVTLGLEQNRLSMLLAVLHRHAGIAMYDQDVFVNVVGGVRISETAADLAVLCAVYSSFRDQPVQAQTAIFGEVGLAGEIRPVPFGEERLYEAGKHGFTRAILPAGNAPRKPVGSLEILAAERLADVIEVL